MSYAPTTDPNFLARLKEWLRSRPEILVLIRYSHMAGSKDFEFFSSFESLARRIEKLPSLACIIAFREPQLPLRGIVDDRFIESCLSMIPDGSTYLLVETAPRSVGGVSWLHHTDGESHAELQEDLEDSRGASVVVGVYPPWIEDTDDVISAVVPDDQGRVNGGVY